MAELELAERLVYALVEVADGGVDVQLRRAQAAEEPISGYKMNPAAVPGAGLEDDRLRSLGLDGCEQILAYLVNGFVPRDSLPFALAALADALHRILDAVGVVHHVAPGTSLLAAAGVPVRAVGIDDGILARLFLAPDDAVPRVHVPQAVAGIAVDEVGAVGDLVPLPLIPVQVFPIAIGPLLKNLPCSVGFSSVKADGVQRKGQRGCPRYLQKSTSRESVFGQT